MRRPWDAAGFYDYTEQRDKLRDFLAIRHWKKDYCPNCVIESAEELKKYEGIALRNYIRPKLIVASKRIKACPKCHRAYRTV